MLFGVCGQILGQVGDSGHVLVEEVGHGEAQAGQVGRGGVVGLDRQAVELGLADVQDVKGASGDSWTNSPTAASFQAGILRAICSGVGRRRSHWRSE